MFWSSLGGDGMMSARMAVQVLKKNCGALQENRLSVIKYFVPNTLDFVYKNFF